MWQWVPLDADLLVHLIGVGESTQACSSPPPAEPPPSDTLSAGPDERSALW